MAKSTVLEDFKTAELTKNCRYFKMRMIKDLRAKTAEKVIKDFIDKDAILHTVDSSSYSRFEDLVTILVTELSSTKEGKFNLYWANTAISNLKSDLSKHKRLFDKLIIAAIQP